MAVSGSGMGGPLRRTRTGIRPFSMAKYSRVSGPSGSLDTGVSSCRLDSDDEVQFVTIMTFDSLQPVIDFQGRDSKRCHVPDAARMVLKGRKRASSHYETVEKREYPAEYFRHRPESPEQAGPAVIATDRA